MIISNYNGRKPSSFLGRITRVSGDIVHVQLSNGRFIAFHKSDVMLSSKAAEGQEVELMINRSAPVES